MTLQDGQLNNKIHQGVSHLFQGGNPYHRQTKDMQNTGLYDERSVLGIKRPRLFQITGKYSDCIVRTKLNKYQPTSEKMLKFHLVFFSFNSDSL